jgi:hypothetical protein
MTMTIFPIEVVDNHVIVTIEGRKVLLDTGSPYCIGEDAFYFLGKDYRKAKDFMGTKLSVLGQHIGANIEFIMGANVLREYCFIIDWRENELRVSPESLPFEGQTIALDTAQPVPVINIPVHGSMTGLYFDTGAKISYLKRSLLEGLEIDSQGSDFHPGFGTFTTPLYKIPIKLGTYEISVPFGYLPAALEGGLMTRSIDGVLGSEIFHSFVARFDYRQKTMTLKMR